MTEDRITHLEKQLEKALQRIGALEAARDSVTQAHGFIAGAAHAAERAAMIVQHGLAHFNLSAYVDEMKSLIEHCQREHIQAEAVLELQRRNARGQGFDLSDEKKPG